MAPVMRGIVLVALVGAACARPKVEGVPLVIEDAGPVLDWLAEQADRAYPGYTVRFISKDRGGWVQRFSKGPGPRIEKLVDVVPRYDGTIGVHIWAATAEVRPRPKLESTDLVRIDHGRVIQMPTPPD